MQCSKIVGGYHMKKLKELLYGMRQEKEKGVSFVHSDEHVHFMSYEDLFKKATCVKNYLCHQGVRKNDEVIITTDTTECFYITFWACLLGDFIAVPLSFSLDDLDKLKGVLEVCHQGVFVTDNQEMYQHINQQALGFKTCICWDLDMLENMGGSPQDTPTERDTFVLSEEESGMDIAYIQFSSGSTSSLKGVGITNLGILTNVDNLLGSRDIHGEETFVTWIPLYHNFGLFFNLFMPIRYQQNAHIIDTKYVVKNPVFYLDYCHKVRGTVTSGTNFYLNFIIKLLQEKGIREDWDLSCIHSMFLGAEPISITLCNQFAAYMKGCKFRRSALAPAYGLTEGTLAVSATTDDDCAQKLSVNKESMGMGQPLEIVSDDDPLASDIISVGKVLPAFQLKIVDLAGNQLKDGHFGLIYIAGKCVLKNYYNLERDENFVDAWFNTGDIGFIHDERLYITARYKEMFIYNGKNYYDNDIEKYIHKLGVFQEERVVIHGYRKHIDDVNDSVICFIQGCRDMDTIVSKIKKVLSQLNNVLGIYINDFVLVDVIPKTVSGKVQRYKLLKNYLNGEYDKKLSELAIEMDKVNQIIDCDASSVGDFMAKTLSEVVDHDLDYSGSFVSMGLNSMEIAKLHMAINIKYGDCISIADLFEYTTIEQLAEHIVEKVDGRKESETLIS